LLNNVQPSLHEYWYWLALVSHCLAITSISENVQHHLVIGIGQLISIYSSVSAVKCYAGFFPLQLSEAEALVCNHVHFVILLQHGMRQK